MQTCRHAYMHTCIHTYIHTHIHTYIHAYIDTTHHEWVTDLNMSLSSNVISHCKKEDKWILCFHSTCQLCAQRYILSGNPDDKIKVGNLWPTRSTKHLVEVFLSHHFPLGQAACLTPQPERLFKKNIHIKDSPTWKIVLYKRATSSKTNQDRYSWLWLERVHIISMPQTSETCPHSWSREARIYVCTWSPP